MTPLTCPCLYDNCFESSSHLEICLWLCAPTMLPRPRRVPLFSVPLRLSLSFSLSLSQLFSHSLHLSSPLSFLLPNTFSSTSLLWSPCHSRSVSRSCCCSFLFGSSSSCRFCSAASAISSSRLCRVLLISRSSSWVIRLCRSSLSTCVSFSSSSSSTMKLSPNLIGRSDTGHRDHSRSLCLICRVLSRERGA
jgi:hypothetical protein